MGLAYFAAQWYFQKNQDKRP